MATKVPLTLALNREQANEVKRLCDELGLSEFGFIERAIDVLDWIAKAYMGGRWPLALTSEVSDAIRRDAYTTLNWDYLFPGLIKRKIADLEAKEHPDHANHTD